MKDQALSAVTLAAGRLLDAYLQHCCTDTAFQVCHNLQPKISYPPSPREATAIHRKYAKNKDVLIESFYHTNQTRTCSSRVVGIAMMFG